MTMLDSLAISIPTVLTIVGLLIAYGNFKLNKKKSESSEKKEDVEKVKEEAQKEKEQEARLIAIEKDVQYIRLSIDNFGGRLDDHERRIDKLEKKAIRAKGGK